MVEGDLSGFIVDQGPLLKDDPGRELRAEGGGQVRQRLHRQHPTVRRRFTKHRCDFAAVRTDVDRVIRGPEDATNHYRLAKVILAYPFAQTRRFRECQSAAWEGGLDVRGH